MDKFIGFDIDHKHTLACLVQAGQPDRYRKLRTDVGALREWLETQREPGPNGSVHRFPCCNCRDSPSMCQRRRLVPGSQTCYFLYVINWIIT